MVKKEHGRIVETATEARAATTGQGGRYVLAIATIASALVMVGVFIYFFT